MLFLYLSFALDFRKAKERHWNIFLKRIYWKIISKLVTKFNNRPFCKRWPWTTLIWDAFINYCRTITGPFSPSSISNVWHSLKYASAYGWSSSKPCSSSTVVLRDTIILLTIHGYIYWVVLGVSMKIVLPYILHCTFTQFYDHKHYWITRVIKLWWSHF